MHIYANLVLVLEVYSVSFPHISIPMLSIQPPLCPRVCYLVFHFVNEKELSDSSRDETISIDEIKSRYGIEINGSSTVIRFQAHIWSTGIGDFRVVVERLGWKRVETHDLVYNITGGFPLHLSTILCRPAAASALSSYKPSCVWTALI